MVEIIPEVEKNSTLKKTIDFSDMCPSEVEEAFLEFGEDPRGLEVLRVCFIKEGLTDFTFVTMAHNVFDRQDFVKLEHVLSISKKIGISPECFSRIVFENSEHCFSGNIVPAF